MNAERIEELRKWLALHVQWLKSPVPTPNGDTIKMWTRDYRENMADLLSLLDEAASLAGQPAAPCGEDEITTKQLMTRLDVMDDHYKDTMFCGDWPVLGFKRHNAEVDAIRARLARPAVVSREWVRFQAGEIWSAKTIEDAVDTLADTLKGFGANVEEEK